MTQPAGYSRSQIWLHWLIVLLVAVQILGHDPIAHAWHAALRNEASDNGAGVWLHIGAGLSILALMLWRLSIRLRRGAPPPASDHRQLQLGAALVHWAFYLVLALMALSGLGAWFGMLRTAGEVHEILEKLLLALIALHVAAALYHQVVLRDNLIARILRPRG